MSTRATAQLVELAKGWERIYPSARCSGIVGDARHRRTGGFHVSREDNPRGNYSIVRPQDRWGNGPDDAAAAIDMSMNTHDMTLCTRRLIAVYGNTVDPRRRFVNAFNGTVDGRTARRWDVYAQVVGPASSDHTWHIHAECRRRYVTSAVAVRAWLSALRGESVAGYLAGLGIVVIPTATNRAVAPPYPGRVLQRGDSGPAVGLWQQRMLQRGWHSLGAADSQFGPRTESVVRRFQQHCRVSVDGKIGPATWPLPWTDPLG
jgi:Putative peptidoglycan binding domain